MPHNDVKWVKNPIIQRQCSITSHQTLKISFDTTPTISSAHENGHRIWQIWICYIVLDTLQELVYGERREPFANLKDR